MRRNRHKRKNNHVLIVTSDAVDAEVKQYKIRSRLFRVIALVLCALLGVLAGCFIYGMDFFAEKLENRTALQNVINSMEQEKQGLEEHIAGLNTEIDGLHGEIDGLNEQIAILSKVVEKKTESEEALRQELEKQYLPIEFPLTGAANMEEITEGTPMCIFSAGSGAMVVATAKGTVVVVNDDPEYGHNVWIDHGNGYVTVYKYKGDVRIKQGETVSPGTTLFLIDEDNGRLCYQMMKDGEYINPMDMLAISG